MFKTYLINRWNILADYKEPQNWLLALRVTCLFISLLDGIAVPLVYIFQSETGKLEKVLDSNNNPLKLKVVKTLFLATMDLPGGFIANYSLQPYASTSRTFL